MFTHGKMANSYKIMWMPITPQIGAKDMVEICLESSRGELSHDRVENILKLKSRWGLYPQLIGVKKCPPCLNFLLLSSFVFFVLPPWCFFLVTLVAFLFSFVEFFYMRISILFLGVPYHLYNNLSSNHICKWPLP